MELREDWKIQPVKYPEVHLWVPNAGYLIDFFLFVFYFSVLAGMAQWMSVDL